MYMEKVLPPALSPDIGSTDKRFVSIDIEEDSLVTIEAPKTDALPEINEIKQNASTI
jgi:hypothetical protein